MIAYWICNRNTWFRNSTWMIEFIYDTQIWISLVASSASKECAIFQKITLLSGYGREAHNTLNK